MNEYAIFRLKIQYKSENQGTGEIKKNKLEILVQAANYTDAEAVMNKVEEQYQFNKFEPCVYDIVKTKFCSHDIYGCNGLDTDESNKLTCGLLQHFFAPSFGLYAVETIVFGDKEAKEKDLKETFYIPALNVSEAMSSAMSVLKYYGHDLSECRIPSAKLDNAKYIYLLPHTSEVIFNQANQIF